jgi:uncharacterized membrane protein
VYIWVAFWAGLSVLAMVKMLQIRDWRPEHRESDPISTSNPQSPVSNSRSRRTLFWLLFIAATTAVLYTHYFGVTLLIVENLAFLIWAALAWRENQPPLVRGAGGIIHSIAFWLVAQLICLLAFLPWYF